jgi:hypothetical protein
VRGYAPVPQDTVIAWLERLDAAERA